MSRKRAYCFTLNNYTAAHIALLDAVECRYMVYGKEVGESGTPHLQGYVYWTAAKSFSAVQKIMPQCHLEVAVTTAEAIAYCKKDGDFTERGDIPMSQEDKGTKGGNKEKERWAVALQQARETGEVEDPQIAFIHARNIEYIHGREIMKKARVDTEVVHEWYWGASGTGKSRKAREENPDAYLKMCNKWWDGYTEEEVVLIEDFDKAHGVLNHHMKIWADRYPFLAEKKGAATKIRPQKIIVTSNYSPAMIWSAPEELEPILRRFRVTEFLKMEDYDKS